METTVRTNRLAMVSFAAGLIVFLIMIGAVFRVLSLLNVPPGTDPDQAAGSGTGLFASWSGRLAGLVSAGAIAAGVIALSGIRKSAGLEKGRLIAWSGIALGASWLLFRLLIALFFITALFRPFGPSSEPASQPPPPAPRLVVPPGPQAISMNTIRRCPVSIYLPAACDRPVSLTEPLPRPAAALRKPPEASLPTARTSC